MVKEIKVTVGKSLEPFSHVEEQLRNTFAKHTHEENFLHESHAAKLPNFSQLKALGPHPLLEVQTNLKPPLGWVHLVIEAEGTEDWVKLFIRNDSVYVRGFSNQHEAYEATEPAYVKGSKDPIRSHIIPASYNCKLLDWGVKYAALFGCKNNEDLEDEFKRIVMDPDFAFEAVCFLSNYVHKEGEDSENVAMKMLGGLTFLVCEFIRMKIRANFPGCLMGTFTQKAQHYGDICLQLQKWRTGDFKNWITSKQYEDEKKAPTLWKNLKNMGIKSEVDALTLIFLVLNRDTDYYDNIEKNKSKKIPAGSGKRSKRNKRSTEDKRQGRKDEKAEQTGSSSAHGAGAGKSNSCQLAFMEDGADSLPWGRRRVQLLSFSSNFAIDWIDFHDWHRPQAVYRKDLIDDAQVRMNQLSIGSSSTYVDLALVGPRRPIGAYANIGVEVFPTKTTTREDMRIANSRVTNERGAILDLWPVDNFNDEEPTVHFKDVSGFGENENLRICYMLVPDTVEARVGVELFVGGGEGAYHVTGVIKAWNAAMGDRSVELFTHQTVEVTSGEWTSFPLMVSLLCLPNDGDVEFSVAAYLKLHPCSNAGEESLIVPPHECLKLNRTVTRQEREDGDNKIAVTVIMST